MPNPTSYTWVAASDVTSPTFRVEVVNAFLLRVIFNEPVNMVEALDVSNYSIPGLVLGAVTAESATVFLVTTSRMSAISYTLTVSNVSDTQGNII